MIGQFAEVNNTCIFTFWFSYESLSQKYLLVIETHRVMLVWTYKLKTSASICSTTILGVPTTTGRSWFNYSSTTTTPLQQLLLYNNYSSTTTTPLQQLLLYNNYSSTTTTTATTTFCRTTLTITYINLHIHHPPCCFSTHKSCRTSLMKNETVSQRYLNTV